MTLQSDPRLLDLLSCAWCGRFLSSLLRLWLIIAWRKMKA